MRRKRRIRFGLTLIETLVALALLASLLLFWRPLVQLAQRTSGVDQEFQAVLTFEAQLQAFGQQQVMTVSNGDLLFQGDKSYRLSWYPASQLLRVSGAKGGYMPLLVNVQSIQWRQLTANRVAYVLTMTTKRRYEGVVTNEAP